jgi:hypothetical protein
MRTERQKNWQFWLYIDRAFTFSLGNYASRDRHLQKKFSSG